MALDISQLILKQIKPERKFALIIKEPEVTHHIVVRQEHWVAIDAEWHTVFLAVLMASALTLMVHELLIADKQTEIIKGVHKLPRRSLD